MKAYLIDVGKFEIVEEKDLEEDYYPPQEINNNVPYDFQYMKITQSFFKNHFIHKLNNEKGIPDFIAINVDDPNDFKYIEFKSNLDSLRIAQILWLARNKNKKRYLLVLSKIEGRMKESVKTQLTEKRNKLNEVLERINNHEEKELELWENE